MWRLREFETVFSLESSSLYLYPLFPHPRFRLSAAFLFFFPFFFFSNIRHFRPFHISRFSFIEIVDTVCSEFYTNVD